MKSFFSFLVIICATTWYAGAQTGLDTLYQQGTTWRNFVFFKNNFPSNSPATYTARTETIEHDTVVNGKTYHLVSGYSDGGYSVSNSQVTYFSSTVTKEVYAGIRVEGEKVYRITFGMATPNTEDLIYNFALTVGDTMFATQSASSSDKVVLAVDTVYLSNGAKLRKYRFQYFNNQIEDYWVEGIGSRLGFTTPDSWMYPPTFTRALCYKSVDGYQYTFPDSNLVGSLSSNCFTLPTAVQEMGRGTSEVRIYPNPVSGDWITIQAPKPVALIDLYDITGKWISSSPGGQSSVTRVQMPQQAGIYLVDIQMTDGSRLKKKVVRP